MLTRQNRCDPWHLPSMFLGMPVTRGDGAGDRDILVTSGPGKKGPPHVRLNVRNVIRGDGLARQERLPDGFTTSREKSCEPQNTECNSDCFRSPYWPGLRSIRARVRAELLRASLRLWASLRSKGFSRRLRLQSGTDNAFLWRWLGPGEYLGPFESGRRGSDDPSLKLILHLRSSASGIG